MPSPCNNLNVVPIKVSKLVRYQNLDANDFFLTVESGSSLTSRRSTLADLKNALNKLTGSYTGSFLGRFSGSFTGSFKGKLSGSFSGSHYGKFIGKNAKVSGSFSGSFYGISNFSKTSSYLLQTTQNTTKGVGYFDGTRLISAPGLVFDNNNSGIKSLSVSSSLSFNYLLVASRGSAGYNQAGITFSNYNNNKIYPNTSQWTLLSNNSGSLTFVSPIGSYQFSSSGVVAKSTTGEAYGMVQTRNGFYFWPYAASNTPSRDGAIGIGVQPPMSPTGSFSKYLRAKLHINMFSGSGEGPWSPKATVENRAAAILVQYGSGSVFTGVNTTFYVSASGNTLVGGKLNVSRGITGSLYGTGFKTLNSKSVSFWGTGSHAVSASFVGGPSRLYNSFNNASDSTNFAPYTWSLSVTKPTGAVWSEFSCFIDHLGRTDDGLTLTGNILFNSDGTNVSSQYSNNTGCGNSGMTWGGTVDNDSCLIHWHHEGIVRAADSTSNTYTLRFVINKSAGSYDLGTPTTFYGIKAKYYIP